MTDDAFLRELEAFTLSEREFGHHAHVRAAYLYLGQSNFAEALVRMRRSICAYATHLGRPDRHHETITIAHLALIQRCIVEHGDRGGWAMRHHRWPSFFLDWDMGGKSPHIRYHQPGNVVRDIPSTDHPATTGREHRALGKKP